MIGPASLELRSARRPSGRLRRRLDGSVLAVAPRPGTMRRIASRFNGRQAKGCSIAFINYSQPMRTVDVFVVAVPKLSNPIRAMLAEEIQDLVDAFLEDWREGVLERLL